MTHFPTIFRSVMRLTLLESPFIPIRQAIHKWVRRLLALSAVAWILPVVILVRALRPLVLVRFGPLRSERLGHFTVNTEAYLCQRDLGMQAQRTFDIFFHGGPVCNQQLKRMWERLFHITRLASFAYRLNNILPGGGVHTINMPSDRDIHPVLNHTSPHLSFTPEEESLANEGLRALGITDNTPFVCFHARDSAYLDASDASRDWGYHDYRDSSIQNCVPAVEQLADRGYRAIRVGSAVKEKLTTNHSGVIDYAFNGRSDFMDVYLLAKCRFLLTGTAGVAGVSQIFRVPLAVMNTIPLEYNPAGSQDIYIFKQLWLRSESRFMTMREMLKSGASRFLSGEEYDSLGIEPVENTPEEIQGLALEMDERLNGSWQTTPEDRELQERFWSLIEPEHVCYGSNSRIGADFLRRHPYLLD